MSQESRDKFLYDILCDWYYHKTTGSEEEYMQTSEESEAFAKKIMDLIQREVQGTLT
jgi:hypothetical protein